MNHPIRSLTITTHHLPLLSRKEQKNTDACLNEASYVARGVLLGSFSNQFHIDAEDEVLFRGSFCGFFEQQHRQQQPEQFQSTQIYFEGKIDGFDIISINGILDSRSKSELFGHTFWGYFKGTIEKQNKTFILRNQSLSIQYLKNESIIQEKEEKSYIIPVFARFTLKNINTVRLEQASALVSGDLLIDIKLTQSLMTHFQSIPSLSISLDLNRQNTIELPLKRKGSQKDGDNDITYSYDPKTSIIKYTIRKIFQAEVQSSYKQFFVPFNLLYLKIVLSFLDLKVKYPEESPCQSSNQQISKKFDILSEENSSKEKSLKEETKRRKKALSKSKKYLHFKFLCLDLDDYIEPNNPYASYNDLWERGRGQISNRITKINFIKPIECGDFRLSTNNLSLFPYYKTSLFNTTRKNTSFYWNLGLEDRDKYIVNPEVRSIRNQFKFRLQNQSAQKRKLFEVANWRNVHIEIPIYKYWVIYIIQICVPLMILSVISMFIFLQENGKSEGQSVFNLRIANATAILLAYVAMIPVFKDSTSKATYFSFFYIIIYLSIIPLILALISSVLDANVEVSLWKEVYEPFGDPYFLASFAFLSFLVLIMFLVVIVASCISLKNYQINFRLNKTSFKKMIDAQEPTGYLDYLNKVNFFRGNQYKYSTISDIDELGNPLINGTNKMFF